ncbi:MAG: TraB/GumN family protein, partial [Gammaproteobacteria bacterium]
LALPTKTLEDFSAIADYYEHEFSRDEQIRLLAEAVCNQALLTQAVQQQTAAYAANDVDTFYRLLHEFDGSDPALSTKLLDVFVRQRNARFWHKLWPEIQQGGAFIAIGGLHLFGEGGLLPRLREQAGVTLRAIEPASLHFRFAVTERPAVLNWLLNRLQGMGLTGMSKTGLAAATMAHVPLSELRERLCPGRLCQIESSYSAADQTLLFRDDIFARLLLEPTPATRNVRAYADSLLVRELMRHALSGRLQTAQASAKCINNAILHLASLAQHDYLREHQVYAKSHLFPLDPRCPVLELR